MFQDKSEKDEFPLNILNYLVGFLFSLVWNWFPRIVWVENQFEENIKKSSVRASEDIHCKNQVAIASHKENKNKTKILGISELVSGRRLTLYVLK